MDLIEKTRSKIDKELKDRESKEDKPIYTSYLETEKYILEQIKIADDAGLAGRGQHTFAIFNKANEQVFYENSFNYENKEFRPIEDDLIDKGAIILPTGIEEYGETGDLVKEIDTFFCSGFEVIRFYEKFLPYLCLFYWVYDKFPFIPYLHFVGRTSTGKTTAMEVFGSICYKPIDASGAITLSPIFRTSSTWRGTLLLDEFESTGDGYKELIAFLKSGTGDRKVLRTEGEGIKSVKAHIAKSPKIFTSEKPIMDAGLQSRTITVMMGENTRPVPLFRLNRFYEQANLLRNKLLLWRFRNLNKIDLKDIEYGFDELKVFDRRVQQVVTPVYYLANDEARKEMINFAQEHQIETLRERRETLDGLIFEIMFDSYKEGNDVTVSLIIEKLGDEKITAKRIANTIRKVLGFEIIRVGHEKVLTVVLDNQEEKINHLASYYGLGVSSASPASPASPAKSANSTIETEEVSLIPEWEKPPSY